MHTGVGGAAARQVSIEEQRRMLKQKQQQEHERVLSEQLIRRMQLEENPPEPGEDDVTNDEVSYAQIKHLWVSMFDVLSIYLNYMRISWLCASQYYQIIHIYYMYPIYIYFHGQILSENVQ